jgi:hypothetical protein
MPSSSLMSLQSYYLGTAFTDAASLAAVLINPARGRIMEMEPPTVEDEKKPRAATALELNDEGCSSIAEQDDDDTFVHQPQDAILTEMMVDYQITNESEFREKISHFVTPIHASILTTCVDYSLEKRTFLDPKQMNPAPFMPNENDSDEAAELARIDHISLHEERINKTLVPIVHIFGPMIRDDNSSNSSSAIDSTATTTSNNDTRPGQNGCVHVHGIFPYFLCRPAICGNDGTKRTKRQEQEQANQKGRGGNDSKEEDGTAADREEATDAPPCLDWNDIEQVKALLPTMHQDLSDCIQNLVNKSEMNNSKKEEDGSSAKGYLIHCLSAVKARGFYGYSTGPTAPFVKIEFYNPRHKWMIRSALEKGNLEAGTQFYGGGSGKFHCYEAHIPFMMQVRASYTLYLSS